MLPGGHESSGSANVSGEHRTDNPATGGGSGHRDVIAEPPPFAVKTGGTLCPCFGVVSRREFLWNLGGSRGGHRRLRQSAESCVCGQRLRADGRDGFSFSRARGRCSWGGALGDAGCGTRGPQNPDLGRRHLSPLQRSSARTAPPPPQTLAPPPIGSVRCRAHRRHCPPDQPGPSSSHPLVPGRPR